MLHGLTGKNAQNPDAPARAGSREKGVDYGRNLLYDTTFGGGCKGVLPKNCGRGRSMLRPRNKKTPHPRRRFFI
jgi:hypothetical protein